MKTKIPSMLLAAAAALSLGVAQAQTFSQEQHLTGQDEAGGPQGQLSYNGYYGYGHRYVPRYGYRSGFSAYAYEPAPGWGYNGPGWRSYSGW